MKILFTNDDGIDSHITRELYETLSAGHEAYLIAPAKDKSGQGAAITLRTAVDVVKLEDKIYSVDGTPADCVFMGLMAIMDGLPDIIISGINKGANMGDDVIHSGTLGAAFTARKMKLPPLAVSIAGRSFENYQSSILATKLMLEYIEQNYSDGPHGGLVFNVNVPNLPFEEIEGFQLTKLGNRGIPLAPELEESEGKISYKIGKSGSPDGDLSGTDFEAIRSNKISVTPLYWDMTNKDMVIGDLPSV
jgi:5'-nucleotidase